MIRICSGGRLVETDLESVSSLSWAPRVRTAEKDARWIGITCMCPLSTRSPGWAQSETANSRDDRAVFTFHLMKQDSTERERPGMRTGTREKRGVIDNQERTIGKDKRVNYNICGWGRLAVPHQRRKPPGRGGAPPGPRGGNPGEKNWGSISVGRGGGRKEKREITRRKERLTFFIHPLAFDRLVKNPLTHGRRTNTGAFIYILRGSLLAQLLVDARPMSSARFS